MKTKFTPGPWRWRGTNKNPDAFCYLNNPTKPETVGACLDGFTDSEANAKLIAAAPELLEALQAALHDIENPGDVLPRSRSTLSMATQQLIREALAKATQ